MYALTSGDCPHRLAIVSCTLRVCGRKNYRLQDIQLSKIYRGSAPNPGSIARGAPSPRSLAARSLAFARYVANELRSQKVFKDRRVKLYQARSGGLRGPREGRVGQRPTPTKQSGEYRARTGDLLVANQALSQLS